MQNVEIQTSAGRMKSLQIGTATFQSVNDFHLTSEDLEIAQKELGETDGKKIQYLNKLKKRLACDKEIQYRTDDDFLLRYLRFRKYDIDKAYYSINKLYSARKKHPEFFALPPELDFFLNTEIYTFLPYRDERGRVLIWMDMRKWNIEEMSLCNIVQLILSVWDVMTMNPSCQINGAIALWDVRGLSVNRVTQFLYPSMIRFVISAMEEIYPLRFKFIIAVHCNRLIHIGYRMSRPFMKKKLAERFKFLGSDMNELHQYINPALIPKEYGGTLEESECSIAQHILDNLPYVRYDRSFGYLSEN